MDAINSVLVQLYGGEQDGFTARFELTPPAPRFFFVWSMKDAPAIDSAKGEKQRMALKAKLATMAYEFFDEREAEDGGRELLYRRAEHADKGVTTA